MTDLVIQHASLRTEIEKALSDTIAKAEFILGPETRSFETELSSWLGAKYARGVASGTEALQLALLACGVRPGDEVITTPFTFIATAEVITQCGAVPVFVDIDPVTYNLDPTLIERKITPRTRFIMPVHLYGHPADMDPIMDIAHRHKLKVIEDCAQSLGAQYNGRKTGLIGDAGCLSFFPSKVLGAYGDGGMVVTNSAEVAEQVEILRNHGCKTKYYHLVPGFNSRLDSLQAAVLRVKLKKLDEWIRMRREKAALLTSLLKPASGITPPSAATWAYHVHNYYTIRLSDKSLNRDRLKDYLAGVGVSTAIYYPVSLHLQAVYKGLGYQKGSMPVSENTQDQVISLPFYPELPEEDIRFMAESILTFCRKP
jgi:dTDP-4-amino-4,6-dideoxygalactose transaminase